MQQSQQSFQNNEQFQESFQLIKDKLNSLSAEAKRHKDINKISKFQQMLEDDYTGQMNTLDKYIKESKIYIVLMGTLSSGKSTFINALLGQQLLPSKNQSCTSQVTYIGHRNVNSNQDTKITINEEEFNNIQQASQKLTNIQEEAQPNFFEKLLKKPTMETVNIKTQSYFHTTLEPDLRDRVFFIDTPGIELSKTTSQQYLEHFGKINQFIKLDEYSIRINLWILNYTTFDSDKELQKNMFKFKNEDEQIQQNKIANQQYKSQQQIPKIQLDDKIWQSNPFFYILNKFDERKQSEDNSEETILQDIKESFHSDNIFMISALDALGYNIMNYGTYDAQELFITKYYMDNKKRLNLKDSSQASKKCIKLIKNNQNLITDQDFNKFTTKISKEIQKQLNNLFDYKLQKLEQLISLLDQKQLEMKKDIQQHQLVKEKLINLQAIFKANLKDYYEQLQYLNNNIFQSIEQLTKHAISQIKRKEKSYVIEKTGQSVLWEIDKQNQYFEKITIYFTKKLKDELQLNIQVELNQLNIYNMKCYDIIQELIVNRMRQQQEQFLEKQVRYLYIDMKIRSYSTFWESGCFSMFRSTPPEFRNGSVSLCAFIAHHSSVDGGSIDKEQLCLKFKRWNSNLKSEIVQQVDLYLENYTKAQCGIEEALERITE